MRLLVPLVPLLVSVPVAALELDPIAASVNRIDIAIAERLIEAEFGPILERTYRDGLVAVAEPTPVQTIKAEGRAGRPVYFLFCDGQLSGFSGRVTQEQLSGIYWQYEPEYRVGIPVTMEYAAGEMYLHLPTEGAMVKILDFGGKSMSIQLDYPEQVWSRSAFNEHCGLDAD